MPTTARADRRRNKWAASRKNFPAAIKELLAADASFDIDAAAPVQREQGSDPRCAPATTVTVFPDTFADGSTGTNAYANDTDCRWQFTPPSNEYVSVAITKLMSEQPDDGLEVYDTQSGDLLAAFTGRWDPADLPEIRSPTAGGKVTARWVTNSYDENAIGELEDVGFEATARSIGSGPNTGCAAEARRVLVERRPGRGGRLDPELGVGDGLPRDDHM